MMRMRMIINNDVMNSDDDEDEIGSKESENKGGTDNNENEHFEPKIFFFPT